MLLKRSISLQVCLLIIISQCHCQSYEEYEGDEGEDQSYHEDGDHPDYSKFYSVDTSAPLITSGDTGEAGFTSPIEFAGFFSPIEFGASTKNEKVKDPFAKQDASISGFTNTKETFPEFDASSTFPKDYFEEAQKEQEGQDNKPESYGISPGPSYISHELPAEEKERPIKLTKINKPKSSHHYEPEYTIGKSSSTVSQYPKAPGNYKATVPTPYQKYSFQPVGEEGFKSKYLGSLLSTVAPFNPAYAKIASTAPTPVYETQSSEHVPSHLKGKNCRRLKKHVEDGQRRKREAMDCYVCEDPSKSSKFTQCSYQSEQDPVNYSEGKSERYSLPSKHSDGYRYKRYSGDEYSDPYEFVKTRSQASYKKPKQQKEEYDDEFVSYYDDAPDKSYSEVQAEQIKTDPANCHKETKNGMTCTTCKDPKTGGNYEQCSYTSEPQEQKYAYVTERKYDSDHPESSETKSVKQQAKPKSLKDEVDNFKPSQDYTSYKLPSEPKQLPEPSTKDYVDNYKPSTDFGKYRAQYNAPKKTQEAEETEETESKEQYPNNFKPTEEFIKHRELFKTSKGTPEEVDEKEKHDNFNPREEFERRLGSYQKPVKKLINDEPYDIPKHFAESTQQKEQIRGLDPALYGSDDSSEAEDADEADEADEAEETSSDEVHPYKDIDEYHFKLFPEFSHQESKQQQVLANNPSETSRKDVEEVLAEFSKKDRSACKKAEKNGMTCYLCVDDKGIQHEECMYVSESKPQASHVAYHEVQQIKKPDNEKALSEQQLSFEPETSASEKRKRFFKKVTTESPVHLVEAASEEINSKIENIKKLPHQKKPIRKLKKQKDIKEPSSSSSNISDRLSEDENEPTQKTPVEFEVGDEEGAFSAETKPVYSKTLGVRLPRYMLEKSEFEKEFDEFAYNP